MKKLNELRPCDACGGSINPVFYQVTIQQAGIDNKAARRGLGLAEHFGGGSAGLMLASVMGTDQDVVIPVGQPVDLVLCMSCTCGISKENYPLAILIEQRAQAIDRAKQNQQEKTA